MLKTVVLTSLLISSGALAQGNPAAPPPPPPLQTHQVNADHTITFRLLAPAAKSVEVKVDAFLKPLPMHMDAKGVWSVTTPALPPEYYDYGFAVNGVDTLDPLNDDAIKNYAYLGDEVLVPGATPMPWELTAVPHGRVDHYQYTTQVAKNLPANQEAYVVYTPPGYDAKKPGGYPVLYLLHGWSETENGWDAEGRANLILDRMLAEGKIVPMIVVMPQGYGDFEFVEHGFGVWGEPAKIVENLNLFSKMLLTEILPAVEGEYDVAQGRENRAITGLSMGGLESLTIGMNHPETFAYVGGMSSAIFGGKTKEEDDAAFAGYIPDAQAKSADLKLLWVACGKTDGLIHANRDFVEWTRSKGFDTTTVETEGAHTWLTWRVNLEQLAPLLFRSH
jgi:enterochelin esterase family protein